LPIASTGGFIGGNISDEQSWRHRTTTSVGVWARWVGTWRNTTIVVGIKSVSINTSLSIKSIEACRTKFQIISKDASWVGGRRSDWVVGNFSSFGVINNLSDPKTHRKLISVKEGQIVVINLVGKQDFVFIEDRRSTVSWSSVSTVNVIS